MATADLILRHGRVYTGEPSAPWAEAIACGDDRILAVGDDAPVMALGDEGTRVVDAGGRLVLPGLIDAHCHLIWGYELGSWVDLTGRPPLAEVERRVREYAALHPDEEILLGHGLDYAALGGETLPGRAELDRLERRRPLLLTAYDGHTGLANSAFVERAVAVVEAQGRDVGEMQIDPASGRPTGVFHRAFDIMGLIPEIQRRRSLDGLRRTIQGASRLGITSAFDVQVELGDLGAYVELDGRGELSVRMHVALYHPRGATPGRYLEYAALARRHRGDWLRVDGVKLYIDGVVETGTAALLSPYADPPGSLGETVYNDKEFRTMVVDLDRLGLQVLTHATGDRGVRIALDAYEEAMKVNGPRPRRHRVEHCEVVDPKDISRFARLGVIPCMMPSHASPSYLARWTEALGQGRTQDGFPMRALREDGARLALASDWPVAPLDPLVGIRDAVGRRAGSDGRERRLSLEEAIHGYTLGAAHACGAEESVGSLAVGKMADFIVLSRDLFRATPEEYTEARVDMTVAGGRVVFEARPVPG